ncbi:PRC-barrel domain-containing protein [Microvirga massiliensis]|uniref:PRC-barrel domain-containing protein n=1 Tax=Microvirga massiliensis TaxID=1033741 RepID=UPI000B158CB1
MAETYRTDSLERGGSSRVYTGSGSYSSQARDFERTDYPTYDVGSRTSDRRSARGPGYYARRSEDRADDLLPVMGIAIGGAVGYMLGLMLAERQSQSGSNRSRQMSGQAGYGQRYRAGPTGMGARDSSRSVETDETTDLIASNKVEGTAVYNRKGERLGDVYNFMVGKRSGRVAYAVMSFGGFLGIGQRYHALPWNVLDYDTDRGGYVIDADKDRLMNAPSYQIGEEPFSQADQMQRIREYWASGQLSL